MLYSSAKYVTASWSVEANTCVQHLKVIGILDEVYMCAVNKERKRHSEMNGGLPAGAVLTLLDHYADFVEFRVE